LPRTASRVRLDARTGAVAGVELGSRAPLSRKAAWAVGPLHFGTWGGTPVRVIYVVGALTPPFLALTGLVFWLRRRARR
jgi:uncharacterized iron-regulated membrane protein